MNSFDMMDIKTNPDNLCNYKILLKIETFIQEYLNQKGYLKIDLPLLSPALIPESYLEVFETEFKYFNKKNKLYLTPSPELFLKRLLAYGIGNCYFLGKSYRNSDSPSDLHSFEFTMLEFYKTQANYMDIADELLNMLQFICRKLYKSNYLTYQKVRVSFEKWEKLTVSQAFKKYAEISQGELFDKGAFLIRAKEKGYQTNNFSYEDIFSQIYTQEIEPYLGKNGYPTLIYDYPAEFAALAKLNQDDKTSQRFEFYIGGVELGDCYSELTDWHEQEKRFIQENIKRNKDKKTQHPIDKGFIEALKYGLDDCAGIAIGVERLALIFANLTSISQLKLVNIV